MTNEQFEQIERLSKKLWGDINNGHEYSMVTYSEFLGIVTEVWERLQEEPVSEDFEKALAREWKGYIDRGAATVDALEDNTQELAFAKGFYRGAQWDKNQAMAEIQSQSMALAHGCPKEEPVSEDLEVTSVEWFNSVKYKSDLSGTPISAFKAGAKWQKENLWKPADGDDLPIFDREVIALEGIVDPTATDCFCGYKVVFAHRPTLEGYDGKSIATGVVEHYTPKTYGEGGWNIPDVKYWLDVELPKEIEL